jgi:ATP-binding protein involved in chromosome partitioning
MNTPFLGHIPLVQGVREAGDAGRPAVFQENTPSSNAFDELVRNFISAFSALAEQKVNK